MFSSQYIVCSKHNYLIYYAISQWPDGLVNLKNHLRDCISMTRGNYMQHIHMKTSASEHEYFVKYNTPERKRIFHAPYHATIVQKGVLQDYVNG